VQVVPASECLTRRVTFPSISTLLIVFQRLIDHYAEPFLYPSYCSASIVRLRETGLEGLDWIQLAQYWAQFRTLVKMILGLQVPW